MAELKYVSVAATPAALVTELVERERAAIKKLEDENHRDRTKGASQLRQAQIRWHEQQIDFLKHLVVLPVPIEAAVPKAPPVDGPVDRAAHFMHLFGLPSEKEGAFLHEVANAIANAPLSDLCIDNEVTPGQWSTLRERLMRLGYPDTGVATRILLCAMAFRRLLVSYDTDRATPKKGKGRRHALTT